MEISTEETCREIGTILRDTYAMVSCPSIFDGDITIDLNVCDIDSEPSLWRAYVCEKDGKRIRFMVALDSSKDEVLINKDDWDLIRYVGVDAGCIYIADYDSFIDTADREKFAKDVTSIACNDAGEGILENFCAVSVSGDGDGEYAVGVMYKLDDMDAPVIGICVEFEER